MSIMNIMPWWAWALVTWTVVLVVFIVITLAAPSNVWDISNKAKSQCDNCTQQSATISDAGDVGALKESQCDCKQLSKLGMCLVLRRPDQCEAPRYGSVVVEPQNTWSNFGYLLAGLLILFSGPKLLGRAVGINFCGMFFTSWLYHASLKNYPQSFDVAWIYVLMLSMIAYAAETLYVRYSEHHLRFPGWLAWILFATPMVFGLLVAILKANGHNLVDSTFATEFLIGVLVVQTAGVFLDRVLQKTPVVAPLFQWLYRHLDNPEFFGRDWLGVGVRLGFAALMVLFGVLGGYLKLGDGCGKSLCSPHSGLQAHACWHVFGAVSLWWSYDFLAQAAFKPAEAMIWIGQNPFETEGN